MLSGSIEQIISAVSNAWTDAARLRLYRHAPNTGGAANRGRRADATGRGCAPCADGPPRRNGISIRAHGKTWGFHDVLFAGKPVTLGRPLASYVMENVAVQKFLFAARISCPNRRRVEHFSFTIRSRNRLDQIKKVVITTQEFGAHGSSINPARSTIRRTAITASST
jgi:2-methylcitrate dehydratase